MAARQTAASLRRLAKSRLSRARELQREANNRFADFEDLMVRAEALEVEERAVRAARAGSKARAVR